MDYINYLKELQIIESIPATSFHQKKEETMQQKHTVKLVTLKLK